MCNQTILSHAQAHIQNNELINIDYSYFTLFSSKIIVSKSEAIKVVLSQIQILF